MSIIAKKMTAVSAIPVSYSAIGGHLGLLHKQLLERVQQHVGTDLREGKVKVTAGRMKELLSEADEVSPWFSVGVGEQTQLALVQFSQPAAKIVSGAKLSGVQEIGASQDSPIGLLDLVLLQPFVEEAVQGIMALLGAGSAAEEAALVQTGRYVSIANFPDLPEEEKWVRLKMPFVVKENPSEDSGLSIDVFLSSMLADAVVQSVQSASNDLVVDPTSPWASHMHGTVLQTALPLKAVVEVLSLSVADCTRLELGQVIRLPGASHKQLSVVTEVGGVLIPLASSTLGVCKSNKAVKLLDDIDPEFISDIGSVTLG